MVNAYEFHLVDHWFGFGVGLRTSGCSLDPYATLAYRHWLRMSALYSSTFHENAATKVSEGVWGPGRRYRNCVDVFTSAVLEPLAFHLTDGFWSSHSSTFTSAAFLNDHKSPGKLISPADKGQIRHVAMAHTTGTTVPCERPRWVSRGKLTKVPGRK